MEWKIIGRDMRVLCSPSTDAPDSLPVDDSSGGQKINIVNGVATGTYDFITYTFHEDSKYIESGNYVAFVDCTAILVGENDFAVAFGQYCVDELVVFKQVDSDYTIGAWTRIFLQCGFLHHTILRCENDIVRFVVFRVFQLGDTDNGLHAIIWTKVEQVLNSAAL